MTGSDADLRLVSMKCPACENDIKPGWAHAVGATPGGCLIITVGRAVTAWKEGLLEPYP